MWKVSSATISITNNSRYNFSYNILHSKGVVFRLDRGTTFFTTTDPININNISIDPSGDGLLCQSEMVLLPPDGSGGSNWYINPENESTATEDQLLIDDDRGWVRTRVILSSIYHVIMKREAATGAVEGIFTCQIGNDINPTRSLYVLYPSELLLTYYIIIISIQIQLNIILLVSGPQILSPFLFS